MDVFTFMATERNRNIPTSKQKSYLVLPTLTERPVNKPLEKQSFSGNSYRNMKKKTSVSLSDSVLGRLEEASKHTRRSKSFIIEEIVECVLGQLGSSIETSDLERAIDACREDIKRRLAEQKSRLSEVPASNPINAGIKERRYQPRTPGLRDSAEAQ
jgi:predicted DNA-binding protein